jgi:hypothetical protein
VVGGRGGVGGVGVWWVGGVGVADGHYLASAATFKAVSGEFSPISQVGLYEFESCAR